MATELKKSPGGYEDLFFDTQGTGQTTQVLRADGTYRTVTKINSSLIPITTTCRAKKQASGAAIGTTDADATLVQILDDLEDLGQPDATTVENSAGSLRIKDSGVSTAKVANNAITLAKVVAATAQGKLLGRSTAGAGNFEEVAVDGTTLEFPAGATIKVKDAGITATQLATDAVTTAKIADANITVAKLGWTPVAYIVKSGTRSWAGGGTTDAATVAGVLATDVVVATVKSWTGGGVAIFLLAAVPSADTITFTWSSNPGASVVQYVVVRAH